MIKSISYCLVAYNEAAQIADCLKSIDRYHRSGDEFVILDQSSGDETRKRVQEVEWSLKAPIHYHVVPYLGICERYRQVSLNHARNDWCFVIDPDERIHGDPHSAIENFGPLDYTLIAFPRIYQVTDYAGVEIPQYLGDDWQPRLLDRNTVSWPSMVHRKPENGRLVRTREVEIRHLWAFDRMLEKIRLYNASANSTLDLARLKALHSAAYERARVAIISALQAKGIFSETYRRRLSAHENVAQAANGLGMSSDG